MFKRIVILIAAAGMMLTVYGCAKAAEPTSTEQVPPATIAPVKTEPAEPKPAPDKETVPPATTAPVKTEQPEPAETLPPLEPISEPLPEPDPQPSIEAWEPQPIDGLTELICEREESGGLIKFFTKYDADADGKKERVSFTSYYTTGDEEPSFSDILITKKDKKYYTYTPATALTSPFHAYAYESADTPIIIFSYYDLQTREKELLLARISGTSLELARLPFDGIDTCKNGTLIRNDNSCKPEELEFERVGD